MNLFQKIRLSARYGIGVYVISAICSLSAAWLCFVLPAFSSACLILKVISVPIILYLFKSFQNKNVIFFYLNLGISRSEYYAVPAVVELIFFFILISISISVGYAIG